MRVPEVQHTPLNVEALVFHVDLFITALAAVYVLGQLPTLLARFSTANEWRGWHLLRPSRVRPSEPPSYPRPLEDGDVSEANTNLASEHSRAHLTQARIQEAQPGMQTNVQQPRHVKAWSSRLPRLAAILRHPLDKGTCVGQAFILLVYFIVLLYPTLYQSNLFTDPVRTGYVSLSQLPVVLALAMRNNPAGTLAGVSYEKINFIHRFVGKMIVLTANIHAVGYAYRWSLQGVLASSVRTPFIAWGVAALAFVDFLYIFALPIVRHKLHNVFKILHVLSSAMIVLCLAWHVPALRRWFIACALIYAFDLALRVLKSRVCSATVTSPDDASGLVLINIPGLGSGWRAGQHVRVRILSRRLGGVRWAEAHPLTIAGPPRAPDGSGMNLILQRTGAWSRALHALALTDGAGDRESRMLDKFTVDPIRVRILVEGPYGGIGHTLPASFAGALLVAGGAGLSFALAILGDTLRTRGGGPRSVRLLWAVRDPAACAPFLRALDALLASKAPGVEVAVVIRYTRAVENADMRLLLPPGVVVEPGRPNLGREFDDMARRTLHLTKETSAEGRGLLVAACGPDGMCQDVSRAVNGLDPAVRDALGGVEYMRESFGV